MSSDPTSSEMEIELEAVAAGAEGSETGQAAAAALPRSPSRVLRDVCSRPDIKSTDDLVRAYSEAEDAEERKALHEWLEHYIDWFPENPVSNLRTGLVKEYAVLAKISPTTAESKELVTKALFTLCNRVTERVYTDEESAAALCCALRDVDESVFEGNVANLVTLAGKLLTKLDPSSNALMEATYESHQRTLLSVRRTFLIILRVAPGQLRPEHEHGVYRTFREQLAKIQGNQAFYPIYFEAQFLRQTLHRLASKPVGRRADVLHLLLNVGVGCAYFFHAAKAFFSVDIDVDALRAGYLCLRDAAASRGVDHGTWYNELVALEAIGMLFQRNGCTLENFKEKYCEALETEMSIRDRDQRKLLQFGIIRLLHSLALDSPAREDRKCICDELGRLAIRCTQSEEGWSESEIYEALLCALRDIDAKGEHVDVSRDTLGKMVAFNKEQAQAIIERGASKHAFGASRQDEEMVLAPTNELFNLVRRTMGAIYGDDDRTRWKSALKEAYQSAVHTMVRLLDDVETLHVGDLDHHLVCSRRRRDRDSQKEPAVGYSLRLQREKDESILTRRAHGSETGAPITLDEFFPVSQDEAKEIQRVLVIGDAGTGKTTIGKKFAYKWSVGELCAQFEVVYFVPLRLVRGDAYPGFKNCPRNLIPEAIARLHYTWSDEDERRSLVAQIGDRLAQPTSLLVLDGLDESDECGRMLTSLAFELPTKVLMLTRPFNFGNEQRRVDLLVECRGMNDEQLERFLKNNRQDREVDRLVQELKRNACAWMASHVPMTAQMIRRLWDNSEAITHNLYVLYTRMANYMWQRHVDKNGAPLVSRDDVFGALREVAFEASRKGESRIMQSLIRDVVPSDYIKQALKQCGLLRLVGADAFEFAHSTFQEYFAGRWIGVRLGVETEGEPTFRFLLKQRYNDKHHGMLMFAMHELWLRDRTAGFARSLHALRLPPREFGGVHQMVRELELVEAFISCKGLEDDDENLDSALRIVSNVPKALELCSEEESLFDFLLAQLQSKIATFKRFPDVFEELLGTCMHRDKCRSKLMALASILFMKSAKLVSLGWQVLRDGCVENTDAEVRTVSMRGLIGVTTVWPTLWEVAEETIISMCHDADIEMRYETFAMLIQEAKALSKESLLFLGSIRKACYDSDVVVRSMASRAIQIVLKARPELLNHVMDEFIALCNDASYEVRRQTLGTINDTMETRPDMSYPLLDAANNAYRDPEDYGERQEATRTFGKMLKINPALWETEEENFVRECTHDDERIRQRAFGLIGEAMKALPQLWERVWRIVSDGCRDAAGDVRGEAYEALRSVARARPELLEQVAREIVKGNSHPDSDVQCESFGELCEVVKEWPGLWEHFRGEIAEGCAHPVGDVRRGSFSALGEVIAQRPELWDDAKELVASGCTDRQGDVRDEAFRTLGERPLHGPKCGSR